MTLNFSLNSAVYFLTVPLYLTLGNLLFWAKLQTQKYYQHSVTCKARWYTNNISHLNRKSTYFKLSAVELTTLTGL